MWSPQHFLEEKLEPKGSTSQATQDERPIRCAKCQQEIAKKSAIFCMRAPYEVQAFVNPHGYTFEVLTVKSATHVVWDTRVSTDFSWFKGYAWRLLFCERCLAHLGWRFEGAGEGDEPNEFFGLVVRAIELPT